MYGYTDNVSIVLALGNGNPVGVTGYVLGGGSAVTNAITGYGSDQILSPRLVTASGSLIDISLTSHPDLLYAIRGAGHFLGLRSITRCENYRIKYSIRIRYLCESHSV